jgi:DNA-binding MarR family transcriptional regulator
MHRPGRIRTDRWYEVALVCRDEPRTIPAIARELGVQSGSIQSIVDSMQRDGLLEKAESDARGVAFKLTRRGKSELRKAQTTEQIERLLPTGERLVFVTEDGHGTAADALAQLAADPAFRWAARIDGPVKWIASFGSGDAGSADRAANALAQAGARAVVGRADAVFNAERLAEYAGRIAPKSKRAITGAS